MNALIQKIDWGKLRIRSRRDWVIFWIFAAILCYAIGSNYSYWPDRWLFRFANPYMTDLNQPYVWGQLTMFLLLFAAVAEAVLFLCRKPAKAKILVLAGTLLMPTIILGGYRIHTDLIVSSLWKETPRLTDFSCNDIDAGKRVSQELTEIQQRELLELCRNLTIVSDKDTQELLKQWYLEDNTEHFMGGDHIDINFAEKYAHRYAFKLRVYDGKIYIWRGYSGKDQEITFFEDNGIVEWLEEVKTST